MFPSFKLISPFLTLTFNPTPKEGTIQSRLYQPIETLHLMYSNSQLKHITIYSCICRHPFSIFLDQLMFQIELMQHNTLLLFLRFSTRLTHTYNMSYISL